MFFGPLIHGKQAVGIGRRGDHRHRTTGGSQPAGQVICAAQMAGEQRHRKAAAFIQHHNGGVGGLALAVGRNGPHRNARRPHKHQGIRRGKLRPADEIVDEMMKPILADIPYAAGDEVAVLVNGLGATPLEEQYVMFRRVKQILDEKDIRVFHTYVGEYATSMEMAGASISLLRLDDELKAYLSASADTPFFKQFQL